MGILADRVLGQTSESPPAGGRPRGSLADRVLGPTTGDSLIQADTLGRQFLPAREIANGIARLQATDETREQGLSLQRRFQDELPTEELARVGLERIEAPERSFLSRTTRSLLGGTLDILSRPGQAVFQGARSGRETGNPLTGIISGLSGRGERADIFDAVDGRDGRRSFLGVQENSTGGSLLGLGADVVLDPINLISFGGSSVARAGLRTAAREFGEETAEQLARRGLSALDETQTARLSELLGGATRLDDFNRSVRGGVQLALPGRARRTLVAGETFRSPLRRAGILDETRGAVRRGAPVAEEGARRTLQTVARESAPSQAIRRNFQVRLDLAQKFGRTVADDFGLLVGRAGARSGLANEAVVDTIDRATKELDRALSATKVSADERRALGERMVRAFDEGRVDAEVALLRTEGFDAAADALTVYQTLNRQAGRLNRSIGRAADGRPDFVPADLDEMASLGISPGSLEFDDVRAPRARASQVGQRGEQLPRVLTGAAERRLRRAGTHAQEDAKAIIENAESIIDANAALRELEGLKGLENALETNPARLVAIQQVQANRAVALDQLAEEMAGEIIDPVNGQRLALIGDSEIVQEQARQLGYKRYDFGAKTVWAPPEIGTEISRVNEVVFRNPNAASDFGNFFDKWMNIWKASATVPVIPFGVGFHARNLTGNLFNNWVAGGIKVEHYTKAQQLQRAITAAQRRLADPEALRPASRPSLAGDSEVDVARTALGDTPEFEVALRQVAGEEGLSEADILDILTMRDQGVITSGFFKTDLHEDAIAKLNPDERLGRFRRIYDNPQDAMLIRTGSNIGHYLETNGRMAHYLGKRAQGLSPDGAMLSVKKHLFDYSDLTSFERNIMRRVMPFYTFMRFNTPLQFQNFVLQPRKIVGAQRFQEALAAIGTDEDFLDGQALPQYALDGGGTPLGRPLSEFFGGTGNPVVFDIEFPAEAALEVVQPFSEILAAFPGFKQLGLRQAEGGMSESLRSIVNMPGGGVTEFIKVGVEHGTETDLFTGAPVTDHSLSAFFWDLTQAATPFAGKTQTRWRDITSPRDGESNAQLSIRRRLIQDLLGVQLTVADPRRQRSELFRRLDAVEQVLLEAEQAGVDVPTITELRDSGLVPEL